MGEMMTMPGDWRKKNPEKKKGELEGLQIVVRECFAAEAAAKEAGHPWEPLNIPNAAEKAALILAQIESVAHTVTRNPGERPFERGGTTEENAEPLGFDVAALRKGVIRFFEPKERLTGFFEKTDPEKETGQ